MGVSRLSGWGPPFPLLPQRWSRATWGHSLVVPFVLGDPTCLLTPQDTDNSSFFFWVRLLEVRRPVLVRTSNLEPRCFPPSPPADTAPPRLPPRSLPFLGLGTGIPVSCVHSHAFFSVPFCPPTLSLPPLHPFSRRDSVPSLHLCIFAFSSLEAVKSPSQSSFSPCWLIHSPHPPQQVNWVAFTHRPLMSTPFRGQAPQTWMGSQLST